MSSLPLAQRRHVQAHHVEPVVEVLAEAPLRRPARAGRGCVAATMRTSTRRGVAPPTRRELPLLQRRAAAWLCRSSGRSPISSRNRVPPCASSNAPGVARVRAGEGALLVAEQLALDQGRRDRAAVHHHKRPLAARAELVERVGQQLLARAALAGDEHGGVGARHLRARREQRLHLRGGVGQARPEHHAPQVVDLGLQPLLLLALPAPLALGKPGAVESDRHFEARASRNRRSEPSTETSSIATSSSTAPRQRSSSSSGSAHSRS